MKRKKLQKIQIAKKEQTSEKNQIRIISLIQIYWKTKRKS